MGPGPGATRHQAPGRHVVATHRLKTDPTITTYACWSSEIRFSAEIMALGSHGGYVYVPAYPAYPHTRCGRRANMDGRLRGRLRLRGYGRWFDFIYIYKRN